MSKRDCSNSWSSKGCQTTNSSEVEYNSECAECYKIRKQAEAEDADYEYQYRVGRSPKRARH